MTIQDLGSIGELVAALATLVTLVYLAIQVRHAKQQFQESTQHARTQFTLERSDRTGDLQRAWFSPDGQNKTMMKALLTEEALTTEENFEFTVQMSIFFGEMLNSEYLHSHELVDSELLVLRKSIFSAYLMMPRVRQYWKSYGRQFYADNIFTDVVEQIIEEIEQRPTV